VTRFDAIRRQLGDIEKHNERAAAKHEMQVNLLCAYRDELEDKLDIAVGMLVGTFHYSKDEAAEEMDAYYRVRQAARKAVTT